MSKSGVKKVFGSAAVVLAMAMTSITPARAAVYAGTWDPDFGGAFSGLNWTGKIVIDVPDSCLTFASANGAVACSGATLTSAQVFFTGTGGETLDFAADLAGAISYVTFDSNAQVSGIVTDIIGPVMSTSLGSTAPGNKYFDLTFGGPDVGLYYTTYSYQNPQTCSYAASGSSCGYSQTTEGHGLTITLVPEPSTYAMLLAGIAAIGFVSLRRRG